MTPLPVVPRLQVLEYIGVRLFSRAARADDERAPAPEVTKELSAGGVVPTVTPAAHAAHDGPLGEEGPILFACVLAALI